MIKKCTLATTLALSCSTSCQAMPDSFSHLDDSRIIQSMNYATEDNFVGRPIAGYQNKVCILTKEAKEALIQVQNELDTYKKGYKLRVFDCYRPKTAVADFEHWSHHPGDEKMKSTYFPDHPKSDLFKLGYIASQSGHSRGSTVDLTITTTSLTNPLDYTDLDMGTIIDYFGEKSHTDSNNISETAKKNRKFLKTLMEKHGFKNYDKEWWHYTFINEPFPDTYFDFPVK